MNKIIKHTIEEKSQESLTELRRLNSKLQHGNLNEDELAHYGVLGMKWGVRKERENTGSRPRSSNRSQEPREKELKTTLKTIKKNFKKINNAASPEINKAIKGLNTKWPSSRLKNASEKELNSYFKQVSNAVIKSYTRQTQALFGNQISSNVDWGWSFDARKDGYPQFYAALKKKG